MEVCPEHGGYGDVTWDIGPHASPLEEGKVAWVSRERLLRMIPRQCISESAVNSFNQSMARGDVLPVPKVTFEGMKAIVDPTHHSALIAAGRRGATLVPIVYQEGSSGLYGLGGAEPVSPGRPDQGPGHKWRWNGRSWYSNSSFNNIS